MAGALLESVANGVARKRRPCVLWVPGRQSMTLGPSRAWPNPEARHIVRNVHKETVAPALYAARLLRCVSLRGHTPVAAAARRAARRQGEAARRSSRRRSRALLAPARLAAAVAAARHSATGASCAVHSTSLAPRFTTRSHASGRGGSTGRPPSRRSYSPLVAATLARAEVSM